MEKRTDETKEGMDLGEISNVAYQKPLLLLPLVHWVGQLFLSCYTADQPFNDLASDSVLYHLHIQVKCKEFSNKIRVDTF